ncbi:MAG: ribonuclease HII, partial [Acidobacteriota bacterium]
SIGVAEVAEIDRLNVYHAALLAMRRAVEGLSPPPEHLLLDARELEGLDIPQNRFDKGDGIDFSIAAASILAKTHRDRLMIELDRRHPEYGFARHKGYGTPEHQEAIRRHGPCAIHRRSFAVLDELRGALSEPFYDLRERLDRVGTAADLAALEDEVEERRESLSPDEHRKLRSLLRRRWKRV